MDSLILLRPAGQNVLVRNGNIEAILDADTQVADARPVDLPGATLLPGLIDAHVHLTMCGCCTPRQTMLDESNEMLLLRAAENARQALRSGITTLRDCGDRDGVTFTLREAINRGVIEGPRLLLSGPPLTTPRGHCYFMRGEVEGRQQIARRIGELAQRGADLIKVMATGGGLTPGTDSLAMQFPEEELAFIVEEAARHGLPVAAHAHSPESIEACLQAGVQSIEHATFAQHGGIQTNAATLARMRSQGTLVTPTNVPAVIAVREGRTLGLAKELGITSAEFLDGRRRALEEMREVGIRVQVGSDAGATGVPFTALLGEIESFTEAGYTQFEALAAASGTIAPGRPADLVAVEDLTSLKPVMVMLNGRIL